MIKYFQIKKSGISYELDSDIHYYYHLKSGDLLVCEISPNVKLEGCWGVIIKRIIFAEEDRKWSDKYITLDRNTFIGNRIFTKYWDSIRSEKISLMELIDNKYVDDITILINRNVKLELLGL